MMLTWNTIQANGGGWTASTGKRYCKIGAALQANGGGWTASTGKRYCKIGAALIFETDEKNPQEA
jgi:hypothetical protein